MTLLITDSLAIEMHERSKWGKPTARGTNLRYSSSYGCSRQQAYAAFGVIPSNPMDEAGAWVTGLGTIVHEALQDSISRRYPSASFEVSSQVGNFISGSCDALISTSDLDLFDGTHVLFELKTMGTYSFDKQVGWNRMRGTLGNAEGPALKAITQAGMNALGIEEENDDIKIHWLVMGSITFEALSVNKSASMDVSGANRFLSEFWIPRPEWEPLASQELARMASINYAIEHGYLPETLALDDNGKPITLNPSSSSYWQCDYCQFKDNCQADGSATLPITQSVGISIYNNREQEK